MGTRRSAAGRLVLAVALASGGLLVPTQALAQLALPAYSSPEIGADRRVTFRYMAPAARDITVSGELGGRSYSMTRDATGLWSVTTDPLPPDIYTYTFNVDGVTALDPINANTKYGYSIFGAASVVQVPGDGPQFYDVRPVPHGAVRIQPYVSSTLGVARTAWIYTPPGYDDGDNYPVLYLLHGGGDIESGWTMIGRANNILDNLIAEGRARPMVVVMPLGHAIQSFWTGPAATVPDAAMVNAGGSLDAVVAALVSGDGKGGLSPFGRDLVDDVMPMVEDMFKVSRRADHRAIAGLSMGGGQAINLAFSRPDMFRYVVLMSPAAGAGVDAMYPGLFAEPGRVNAQFRLLWLGFGQDDALTGPGDRAFAATLEAHGIAHTLAVSEGRHEWTVWRHNLRDVAPLLFR